MAIALRLLSVTIEMPYQPLPVDQSDVRYIHGPDSALQPGVPAGETVELEWRGSEVYPGTFRKFWVHVPAQYDPAEPASLMVFQDGWWYLDPAGEVRGAIVLDNLIHRGDIPVTIGVFVDPGVFPDAENPKNRNNEYDAFDDRYVTFLLTEIIPQVAERCTIAQSPERWGICGGSSGGNCAFTAAWLRPDKFRRVIGYLSSFAQMPDGNPYPDLISRVPRKPLRIFMQGGHRDLPGMSHSGTGSPKTCAWQPLSLKRATTSALSWETADTAPTTAASCCRTLCAGCGGPTSIDRYTHHPTWRRLR